MLKNEEEQMLIKAKFKTCENYLNELENIFMIEEPITAENFNQAKVAMLIGKLSVQILDLETHLKIYGEVEDNYKEYA